MFIDCPAYMDEEGAARCGLPAEVRCRFTMSSSDGPLESAMIKCPVGHWFSGPIEFLTWDGKINHDQGDTRVASSSRLASVTDKPYGLDGMDIAVRDVPEKLECEFSRPNGAPPYYLGRPAWLWISATRPRRRRVAPDHLTGRGSVNMVAIGTVR